MKTAETDFSDLEYIKRELDIDPATTSKEEAQTILRKHKINTTSWVLTRLEEQYGEKWGDDYRKSIAKETCDHGFFSPCPYCRWGTD